MNTEKVISSVADYRLLGRTGLRVSSLCLGTMTFGTEWGWGSEKHAAREIFDRYLESGGNFLDTADAYTNGRSEEWLGEFIQETKTRDQVVLATKYTFGSIPGEPNSGGNGRKAMYRALEGSLRRLKTDYVDLYWMHVWDTHTPIEEVMSTANDFVRSGKIRAFGLSDVPAWYASRAQTLAEWRGWEKVSALQLEYSLVSRNLEREHLTMAKELGMGICPWSPLAGGFLTGKYKREQNKIVGEGRVQVTKDSGNPALDKVSDERNWKVLDALLVIAKEVGHTPAEVALNFIATQPGVTSTLIGATKMAQLESNLRALEFTIPEPLRKKVEDVSRPLPNELDNFFAPTLQGWISGGTKIRNI